MVVELRKQQFTCFFIDTPLPRRPNRIHQT
jgi:hypothetical protein